PADRARRGGRLLDLDHPRQVADGDRQRRHDHLLDARRAVGDRHRSGGAGLAHANRRRVAVDRRDRALRHLLALLHDAGAAPRRALRRRNAARRRHAMSAIPFADTPAAAATASAPRWRWLPAPGTWRYHALLLALGILVLGPLGGLTASYMNFSIGFFVGGQ